MEGEAEVIERSEVSSPNASRASQRRCAGTSPGQAAMQASNALASPANSAREASSNRGRWLAMPLMKRYSPHRQRAVATSYNCERGGLTMGGRRGLNNRFHDGHKTSDRVKPFQTFRKLGEPT